MRCRARSGFTCTAMPAFEQTLRIYYQDTDAMGVVFHANYLMFAERGRTEALHAVGAPVSAMRSELGLHYMARHIELEYMRPLMLDDRVLMRTATIELGASSCRIGHTFFKHGALTTRIVLRLVCVREEDARPVRIPGRWRDALAALMDDGAPPLRAEPVPV